MKKIFCTSIVVIVIIGLFSACDSAKKVDLQTKDDSVAYVIGTIMGKNLSDNLKRDSLDARFSQEILIQGFNDALLGLDTTIFTEEQKQAIMGAFQAEMQQKQMEQMTKAAQPNKEAGAKWLEENKKKEGIVQTASGLQYKVIKMGSGKQPTMNDQVKVNYEGKLLDGKVFDSSYERKEPLTIPVGGVIKGWQEGLMLMKEGSVFELYIPSDLGYGDMGNQNIPGGSTLIFKVELIKVEAGTTQENNQQVPKVN